MRQVILLAVLVCGGLVAAPAVAATPPWWFTVGFNGAHVKDSEVNCGGNQGAFSFGGKLMLRAQFSMISFEDEDRGGSCDLGIWGDSAVVEPALMIGVISRAGAFVAVGPARADFGDPTAFDNPDTPRGEDTGTRFELGWSSRHRSNSPVGFEVVLFQTTNDIRNYAGLGLNMTFGPRRSRVSARPPSAQ